MLEEYKIKKKCCININTLSYIFKQIYFYLKSNDLSFIMQNLDMVLVYSLLFFGPLQNLLCKLIYLLFITVETINSKAYS